MPRVYLAHAEWQGLGFRRRRQVARLAAKRREHPDPYVAAVARAWATDVLRIEGQRRARSRRATLVESALGVVSIGVAAILGDAAFGASIDVGREARLARRILAAAEADQ